MSPKVKLHYLERMHYELNNELQKAVEPVYKSGVHILGEQIQEFENQLAKIHQVKYATVVGSGSDALMFACQSLWNHNSTVIVPAQTFKATLNSVVRAGLIPQITDVDERGLLPMFSTDYETKNTIFVSLFGNRHRSQIDNLSNIKLSATVIEDNAQGFGIKPVGIAATLSFDPTKQLPNWGNGGAVLTNSGSIHKKVTKLRRHMKTENNMYGGNSIMSERDCAEMLVKLKYYKTWEDRRNEIAHKYTVNFSSLINSGILQIVNFSNSIKSKFVIKFHISEKYILQLKLHLQNREIAFKSVYPEPIALLPVAADNCKRMISLPFDPYTTNDELNYVIDSIKEFFTINVLKM